jgi:hypothetical protein
MARFILEAAGEDITVGGSDVEVIGTTAGGEEITVVGGNITFDNSFNAGGDTIALAGEAEDYTARISGSRVILTSTVNGTTVSIPVGTAGLDIEFGGDDTRTLQIEGGVLVLGDQTIASTGDTTLEPGADDLTAVQALAVLQAAEVALAEFEAEQEATGDDLRAALDTAEATLAAERATRSDAQLEADLISANADLDAAETDVAAVPGLAAAIEERDEADAALDAAIAAYEVAFEAEEVAVAAYNARFSADITSDTLELDIDGAWTGSVEVGGVTVIEVAPGAGGQPRLVAGVTETTNPGITAVLNTIVATERAEIAYEEAILDYIDALEAVDLLDQVASADDEREALADLTAAVAAYNTALNAYEANQTGATATALETAYAGLLTNGVADAVAGADTAANIVADADDVEVAIEDRQEVLYDALVAAESSNPLTENYDQQVDDQEVAQGAVDARNGLIDGVSDAQELVNQVEALENDVADAQDYLVDMGYTVPVTVEGATEIATAGNDIFVFAEEDGSIDNFGDAGDDILYIGTGYTLVNLAAGVDLGSTNQGVVNRLDVFIQQDGTDTVLYFEDVVQAGSNTTGFTGYTVVLEDVDASTVSYDSTGYITVGDTTFA